MAAGSVAGLALIVRGHPWQHRAARADLDLALAAAAMDFRLEVYFLGEALMQLAADRDSEAALLPPGYRAWAALPELADARFYGESEWLDRCASASIELTLPVRALSAEQMQAGWRRCRHALVL
jgi:sulfur relay (sulfurtransferase) DsrF/TusC family protein